MIKLLTALIVAIFLTACGDDNGQTKTFETETKASTQPAKTPIEKETPESNTTVEKPQETVKKPEESYAKDIFELSTITGDSLHVDEVKNGISFQEHKDKVVFLLFFGYRCPPCLEEIPALNRIYKEKKDKLEIIGLEVQRLPEDQLKIFAESKKLEYTILSGEYTQNSKFISYIAERAQWTGAIPFMVGIKPNGEVGMVHLGGMTYEDFKSVFNKLSK